VIGFLCGLGFKIIYGNHYDWYDVRIIRSFLDYRILINYHSLFLDLEILVM
jgi:hypothetical protein